MTYQAAFYDTVTPATVLGDVSWYRGKALELGGPVLELGPGTGRITVEIAGSGVPIHALDASSAMLDVLLAKLRSRPAHEQALVTPVVG